MMERDITGCFRRLFFCKSLCFCLLVAAIAYVSPARSEALWSFRMNSATEAQKIEARAGGEFQVAALAVDMKRSRPVEPAAEAVVRAQAEISSHEHHTEGLAALYLRVPACFLVHDSAWPSNSPGESSLHGGAAKVLPGADRESSLGILPTVGFFGHLSSQSNRIAGFALGYGLPDEDGNEELPSVDSTRVAFMYGLRF
jgi:hypothetical protein